jgi:hypothetical protein
VLGACLLLWCMGASTPDNSIRATVAQDVYRKGGETTRLIQAEVGPFWAGWMNLPTTEDAFILAVLPVRLEVGRITVDGGGARGSAEFPKRGTSWNWAARARINLTSYLSLDYVHFSNSGAGKPNPSLDMVGISVRVQR